MQNINWAIVIPTLNEQYFIGRLLDSLAHQTVQPKEIIVVDAYSKDKTIAEVKKRKKELPQLTYYQIPRSTISRQRNFGVSKSRQLYLLFLDADMSLGSPNILKDYYQEVLETKPDVAAAFNLPQSDYWKDKLFFHLMNLFFLLSRPVRPMAGYGLNLYVKRSIFNEAGGFDEQILIGEDQELVQRIVKRGGKFIFLEKVRLYTSVRRFEKEGRLKFLWRVTQSFFYIIRFGYRGNPVEYEFGRFKPKETKQS